MSRQCEICKKVRVSGSSISRRGMAKAKGGVGKKTTGVAKRQFYPNLQPRRITVNGKIVKVLVCAKCIKAGKVIAPAAKKPE